MTQNQLKFQELQENKRHNVASENINKYSADAQHKRGDAALSQARTADYLKKSSAFKNYMGGISDMANTFGTTSKLAGQAFGGAL